MGQRETWTEVFRSLGEAILEVVRAEMAVLGEDWKSSGKRLGIGAGLAVAALGLLFWLIPLGLFTAVTGLARWRSLELWLASAIVGLGALVIILFLVAIAYFGFFRKIENPLAAARRRMGNHMNWWQEQLAPPPQMTAGGSDGGRNESSGET